MFNDFFFLYSFGVNSNFHFGSANSEDNVCLFLKFFLLEFCFHSGSPPPFYLWVLLLPLQRCCFTRGLVN